MTWYSVKKLLVYAIALAILMWILVPIVLGLVTALMP